MRPGSCVCVVFVCFGFWRIFLAFVFAVGAVFRGVFLWFLGWGPKLCTPCSVRYRTQNEAEPCRDQRRWLEPVRPRRLLKAVSTCKMLKERLPKAVLTCKKKLGRARSQTHGGWKRTRGSSRMPGRAQKDGTSKISKTSRIIVNGKQKQADTGGRQRTTTTGVAVGSSGIMKMRTAVAAGTRRTGTATGWRTGGAPAEDTAQSQPPRGHTKKRTRRTRRGPKRPAPAQSQSR